MAALRISPPLVLIRPTRMVERNLLVYRRTFMVIFSGFFEPLFYLFSMGFGVGRWSARSSLATAPAFRTPSSWRLRCWPRRR